MRLACPSLFDGRRGGYLPLDRHRSLIVMRRMMTKPMVLHGSAAVPPIVMKVTAISVRIARSQILAICVRVELLAHSGIIDNGLRHGGRCGSCGDKNGDAKQCQFHLGLLAGLLVSMNKMWAAVGPGNKRFRWSV